MNRRNSTTYTRYMILDDVETMPRGKEESPLPKPKLHTSHHLVVSPKSRSPSALLHDKSVRPVSQHALPDLVKSIVLDVARDDHRVGVSHVGDVHAFLLELWQRIQDRGHLSLESGKARARLRRFRVLLRWNGSVRVIDDIDDDVLDLALELPQYVHESLGGGRCVLGF